MGKNRSSGYRLGKFLANDFIRHNSFPPGTVPMRRGHTHDGGMRYDLMHNKYRHAIISINPDTGEVRLVTRRYPGHGKVPVLENYTAKTFREHVMDTCPSPQKPSPPISNAMLRNSLGLKD